MKFINEDFLLNTTSAKILYHSYAKDMPIYDFHCHLSPKEIAENKRFKNITEMWLAGDHYKWRAMRSIGIDEKYITGDASDKEKFQAWIKTVPYTVGNPLYHWTHLELKRYFNYSKVVKEEDWEAIWETCNEQLQLDTFTAQQLIKESNVKVICTTDDPIDNLQHHHTIKASSLTAKVLPTFRPDKALEIKKRGFIAYIDELSNVVGNAINTYDDFLEAMESRVHYFHEVGCRISDHGFEKIVFEETSMEEAREIFNRAIKGEAISQLEEAKYKTYTMEYLGSLYHKLGWAMQLHIGALRNNNTSQFDLLGPDSGYDSMNDYSLAQPLNKLLNMLEKNNKLPRTIIYPLNPVHSELVASTIGNFQSNEIKGKVQLGSAWWFNDHKVGMLKQMTDIANIGLLSTFVGMLTDSRSFLSYPRHEYFRRILCQMFGDWMEKGEVPMDYEFIGSIIQDICYNNANNYFTIN
ncbi:glucuronate isomerase [Sutcliffiella horikoshii]|uniref:glucuronate isomerase n=1 Tax=Sutcliffiella horikoshii TaxID=79883 RepID=UPI001CFDA379|nr:glucuronate isomerase [Sutcliffiella horikoshii]